MEIDYEVLRRISPSIDQRESIKLVSQELMARVNQAALETGLDLQVKLVGSVAKDTYIFRPDIDIFILFPTSTEQKEFQKAGLWIGHHVLEGEERYAEHPYVHGNFQGFEADIVPCYAILDPVGLKSAVDRTPFHTEFIMKRLEEPQKDQVRLLKQFMKGVGVYGAESKVRGFSGYLVELMILKYRDFRSVLRAASKWMDGTILAIDEFGESLFKTPLVFYDPIDPNRNVASALSIDAFARFIFSSQDYLKSPKISFFFPEDRTEWSNGEVESFMAERGTKLLGLRIPRPRLIDDNLYPQARKSLEGIRSVLENNDFVVLDGAFSIGEESITFLFELQTDELPVLKKHRGPPVWVDQSEQFLEKWKGNSLGDPYIDGGRWYANVRRAYPKASELLKGETSKASFGSDLRDLSAIEIFDNEQLMRGHLNLEVTTLLDKTLPWLR
jgi:tRNA nucleotidyltransferase (CCA-adding enzyme)